MTKEGSGPTEQLTAVTAERLEAETAVLIVTHLVFVLSICLFAVIDSKVGSPSCSFFLRSLYSKSSYSCGKKKQLVRQVVLKSPKTM